jgi:hypothetical protein
MGDSDGRLGRETRIKDSESDAGLGEHVTRIRDLEDWKDMMGDSDALGPGLGGCPRPG